MSIKQSILVASFLMLSAQFINAQEAEIKKVIAAETEAYYKRDAATLLAQMAQDPSTSTAIVNDFGLTTHKGYDTIKARIERLFKNNPEPQVVKIETDSFDIRQEGKMAVVDYKQTTTDEKAMPPFKQFVTWEHRVLVKKEGKWKISKLATTFLSYYNENYNELSLNGVGYMLMAQGKNDEAVQVLELNAKLFPGSFNVHDSLGEAYAAAGKKEQAIAEYEKSLQIFPGNESGQIALKKLK